MHVIWARTPDGTACIASMITGLLTTTLKTWSQLAVLASAAGLRANFLEKRGVLCMFSTCSVRILVDTGKL